MRIRRPAAVGTTRASHGRHRIRHRLTRTAAPWYRLHFSTYVVLLIPLSVLALVAVPGYNVICWEGGMTETYFFQEHGWPLVHSDHKVVVLLAPGASPCLGRDFWSLCEQRSASSLRWAKATGASADRGVVRSGWRSPASWKQTGTGGGCPQGGPGDQSPRGPGHLRSPCRALRVVAAAILPVQSPQPAGAVRGGRRRLRLFPLAGGPAESRGGGD